MTSSTVTLADRSVMEATCLGTCGACVPVIDRIRTLFGSSSTVLGSSSLPSRIRLRLVQRRGLRRGGQAG